ncbi:hypothetical protein SprV_0702432400 [Sparganum proliferum]
MSSVVAVAVPTSSSLRAAIMAMSGVIAQGLAASSEGDGDGGSYDRLATCLLCLSGHGVLAQRAVWDLAWQPGNVDVSWILVDQRDDVRYELQLSKDCAQVDDLLAMDRWHDANSIALAYETFTKGYPVFRNFRTFS